MDRLRVRITYYTGIADELFQQPLLLGSWDVHGRYSDQWIGTPMEVVRAHDGCAAFTANVGLSTEQIGWLFRWGIKVDGPAGNQQWAIIEEVNDERSRDRVCTFRLHPPVADGRPQEVAYFLNHSRRLGAQKYYDGSDRPKIRFAVWAPNAKKVDVAMAELWHDVDTQRSVTIDPSKTPANQSLPRGETGGGYIADNGEGMLKFWGPFPMEHVGDGMWATRTDDPRLSDFAKFDHSPYMFQVTKDDESTAFRTDLYSRCQIGFGSKRPNGAFFGRTTDLDGTVSCSVVVDPDQVTADFSEPVWPETKWMSQGDFWNDADFQPVKEVPRRLEDLMIYELHVGALGFGRAETDAGTLDDALRLLDYLENLGINAIELLPLSEFGGGGGGWGYATSHYFAIEYSGGGRDNYKWFIRECHRRGIAVILDIVFNHYNHNADRAEWMFDSNAHEKNIYYWYEGKPDDYKEFNKSVEPDRWGTGGYLDNLSTAWAPRYYEPHVRSMFVSAAISQALEFKIDGFRLDQTTSIHDYNVLHADGRRIERANAFGRKLLRELTRALKFVKPNIMLMAEDHSNLELVTESTEESGLGFDATWFADFYHHLIGDTDKGSDYAKLIKTAGLGDDRPLAMDYFAPVLEASRFKKIVFHESHDEAGNGKFTHRTINTAVNGAPLVGRTRAVAEARCRFAAGVSLLSAGTPMFLFGEEVGAENDFLYGHVLENREDLQGLRHGFGRDLFEFFRQLIRLRLGRVGLRSRNIKVVYTNNEHRLLAFRRWAALDEYLVVASLNNRPFNQPDYTIRGDGILEGSWKEIFNSDAMAFGGDNVGNDGAAVNARRGEFICVIPANGFVVFQRNT